MSYLILRAMASCLSRITGKADYSDEVIHPYGFEQLLGWQREAATFDPSTAYFYLSNRASVSPGEVTDFLARTFSDGAPEISMFDETVPVLTIDTTRRVFIFSLDVQETLLADYADYIFNFPQCFLDGVLWESPSAHHDPLSVRRFYQMTRICWNLCYGTELPDGDLIALSERRLNEDEAGRNMATGKAAARARSALARMARDLDTRSSGSAQVLDFSTGKRIGTAGRKADVAFSGQVRAAYANGMRRILGTPH